MYHSNACHTGVMMKWISFSAFGECQNRFSASPSSECFEVLSINLSIISKNKFASEILWSEEFSRHSIFKWPETYELLDGYEGFDFSQLKAEYRYFYKLLSNRTFTWSDLIYSLKSDP